MIGQTLLFTYPSEFSTLPEYREHSGQSCFVERQLTPDEADIGDDLEKLYKVRFSDGFIADVFESELSPITN